MPTLQPGTTVNYLHFPTGVPSRFVERILTVVETCRQQQRPVFDFLRQALMAYRAGQSAPSLLPAL